MQPTDNITTHQIQQNTLAAFLHSKMPKFVPPNKPTKGWQQLQVVKPSVRERENNTSCNTVKQRPKQQQRLQQSKQNNHQQKLHKSKINHCKLNPENKNMQAPCKATNPMKLCKTTKFAVFAINNVLPVAIPCCFNGHSVVVVWHLGNGAITGGTLPGAPMFLRCHTKHTFHCPCCASLVDK